ncbi:MAG TPA: class I SAM-dependent methyltransferase [Sulfuricaulis sp.]|jgi:demethylmenaquinone methyltransferase/2-methoxy-6-polyprenyl-1,4-benzoquinol methylase|nr:class I SAM-dependent methyltransferase [Sulfuricaulis sp.]
MANGERAILFSDRENVREQSFKRVWTQELDEVFADVAKYYDRANYVASLGQWNRFRDSFLATIELKSGQRALDVCAGTNAVGIALLRKQPDLKVYAMDRSAAMQEVGRKLASQEEFHIESVIGDVHKLPFPDNHFDVVTLQWASRHLRIMDVCGEIRRVLKPGGNFYHCDMLRPGNKVVEKLYYTYLRASLSITAMLFQSGEAARNCKKYFINALSLFYSAEEFSQMLRQMGFENISSKTLLSGMIGFHRAMKP